MYVFSPEDVIILNLKDQWFQRGVKETIYIPSIDTAGHQLLALLVAEEGRKLQRILLFIWSVKGFFFKPVQEKLGVVGWSFFVND